MSELYHGDCLAIMLTIPQHSVDLILCDLPYGTTQAKWDSIIPLDALWEQYRRLLKPNGCVVLFGSQPFTSKLIASNPDWFRYELIWSKSKSTGFLDCHKKPLKAHENILVFSPSKTTYNPQMTKGKSHIRGGKSKNTGGEIYGDFSNRKQSISDEYFPTSILHFGFKGKYLHPTQKPTELLTYLIRTFSNENQTVLDNTMGSGSTCVACKQTNRQYIGIEQDQKYFEIAKARIDATDKPAL